MKKKTRDKLAQSLLMIGGTLIVMGIIIGILGIFNEVL